MFKFLLVPAIFGMFAFLVILFVAPIIESEADIVAGVATRTLDFANRYYATTPPLVADYIASLNLPIVAGTAGLLTMIVVQLLVLLGVIFAWLFRAIGWLLRWRPKKPPARDLPPIDIDAKYLDSGEKDKILGRGLDTIDRDP